MELLVPLLSPLLRLSSRIATQCLSTSTSSPTESQRPASLHNTEFSAHSPVGNRTRSHPQKANVQTSGEPVCIDLDPTTSPSATVETDNQSTDVHKSFHPLVLKLPSQKIALI